MGIYGTDIWAFFKDLCKSDLAKMIGVMRAKQFGYISETDLKEAIRGHLAIDMDDLIKTVVENDLPDLKIS